MASRHALRLAIWILALIACWWQLLSLPSSFSLTAGTRELVQTPIARRNASSVWRLAACSEMISPLTAAVVGSPARAFVSCLGILRFGFLGQELSELCVECHKVFSRHSPQVHVPQSRSDVAS